MKEKMILIILCLDLSLYVSACGKKAHVSTNINVPSVVSPIEVSPAKVNPPIQVILKSNPSVQAPDLAQAKNFSVMAYISILSAPTSSIMGKVGLKPGVRSSITLDPIVEVSGGVLNIYAGDDTGDKQILITTARQDLIAAYRDAAARVADKDKAEVFEGQIGGKILPAGVYHWSNGLSVASDLTLEGDENSVWIFQVKGNLDIAQNIQMNLSGGSLAKNIFWQISGRVNIGENSHVLGNYMNQLTFTLKPNAQVVGRVLSKNGKILLSQNVVKLPE